MGLGAFADTEGSVMKFKNVETLNDNIRDHVNQRVQVTGEVDDILSSRTIILESGGILNDKIAVIASPELEDRFGALVEDADVMVTGTVIMRPTTDSRFLNQSNDIENIGVPVQYEAERYFIVADEVTLVEDAD